MKLAKLGFIGFIGFMLVLNFPSKDRVGGRKGIRPSNKCHVIKMQISAAATPNQE